jgi:hypothetical protein
VVPKESFVHCTQGFHYDELNTLSIELHSGHFTICLYNVSTVGLDVKKNSGASVHQRTIPTERPPLVGEVRANFSG